MASDPEFEQLVAEYYRPLYQFAYSLTRAEADASDLTQHTFYVWALKGRQLRDQTKVKTWLFSTLHHEFLNSRRRQTRFPHHEVGQVEHELPPVDPAAIRQLDLRQVLDALSHVDEVFQAPLTLFYLEDYPYRDIAEILNIPIGTVKSRLARGIAQLHRLLSEPTLVEIPKDAHD